MPIWIPAWFPIKHVFSGHFLLILQELTEVKMFNKISYLLSFYMYFIQGKHIAYLIVYSVIQKNNNFKFP
jgi:hypothetical protein